MGRSFLNILKHLKQPGLLIPVLLISVVFGRLPDAEAGGQREAGEEKKMKVFVSILPQVYFVDRVGGRRVETEVLVQPGHSPATYEPTPRQMARLAGARVFFRIGVGFENALLPKIESILKNLDIVDTREGISLRALEGYGEHSSRGDGLDPHIWLSPVLVKRQAETIRDTLISVDPEGEREYMANYTAFAEELDAFHRRIQALLSPFKGKELFVFHPAYGYFTDVYGLKQAAVETGGTEPSARQLAHFIELARERGVKVIFVQPQFSGVGALAVAGAVGGRVETLDPLSGDYLRNLEEMARKIAGALKQR